ncbi:MAG: hypothetical protein LBI81_01630 [Puniceicoccales bacterium]|jgi:hypothetical protein|nr:hypothetical protein [Puniceicoccales bacterium]
MKQIANDLKLQMFPESRLCKAFPMIANLFGRYTLEGDICGKCVRVYTVKFPNFGQFPLRLVARVELGSSEKFSIRVGAKPFSVSLHKIFDKNVFLSNDPILNSRLIFSTDNSQLLRSILFYEEIRDQLCDIWTGKKHGGILLANGGFVAYHEPFRLVTKATRNRIKDAARLICDVADVIKLFAAGKENSPHGNFCQFPQN